MEKFEYIQMIISTHSYYKVPATEENYKECRDRTSAKDRLEYRYGCGGYNDYLFLMDWDNYVDIKLNDYGERGWELVSTVPVCDIDGTNNIIYIFKRKLA